MLTRTNVDCGTCDLAVDAVYPGGRNGGYGDDPLSTLIGVSNEGGFRILGSYDRPRLIVLISSFNDVDWPDSIDRETGIVVYYGDNKKPGRLLHDTPRAGNLMLSKLFDAIHRHPSERIFVPPILLFRKTGIRRDMMFLGLVVPGAQDVRDTEDLVAVWKLAEGQRFQNYRAVFTILDVPVVSREWLNNIKSGCAVVDCAPLAWHQWVDTGLYSPLRAILARIYRSRSEQLPSDALGKSVIAAIYRRFREDFTGFEHCAAKLVQMMDANFVTCNVTRPTRDGGRDATGEYRIGIGISSILLDYALEAKCYKIDNSVGVREMSRLISRLRHRQFGIIVTTSYLHSQAYKELKEDRHPIVVIAAKDIVTILKEAGLSSLSDVEQWLRITKFSV